MRLALVLSLGLVSLAACQTDALSGADVVQDGSTSRLDLAGAHCKSWKNQASCADDSACVASYCCGAFTGCYENGQAPKCPASCPAFCSHTDQASCDADPDCHSALLDPGTIDCVSPPGCALRFSRCAIGPLAQCQPFAAPVAPPCGVNPGVVCEGPYVASYDPKGCPVACVLADRCAPPT